MITFEKLRIFARYKGDGDMFWRSARQIERQVLTNDDWHLIDTLLQDATVVSRQLGSDQRTVEAMKRLTENSENDRVVSEITRLAEIDSKRW